MEVIGLVNIMQLHLLSTPDPGSSHLCHTIRAKVPVVVTFNQQSASLIKSSKASSPDSTSVDVVEATMLEIYPKP